MDNNHTDDYVLVLEDRTEVKNEALYLTCLDPSMSEVFFLVQGTSFACFW